MGGFTVFYLKDVSQENIKKQNEKLKLLGVAKKYRFYSEMDIMLEYDAFVNYAGEFPAHQFPREKIKTLNDFKKYWNPKALGEIFVPYVGSLSFDCYFGRTSKRALRKLGKFFANNLDVIERQRGSFETFVERGMTKREIKLLKEKGII